VVTILFISLSAEQNNLEAEWAEADGGPILRQCPICLRDSIIGHGRRRKQAHDKDHDWYKSAAAFVIAAARHSLSCRYSLHLTATTAWSPGVKRFACTLWKAVTGKSRHRRSRIPTGWLILPPFADGFEVWIPLGHRFRSCAPPCIW